MIQLKVQIMLIKRIKYIILGIFILTGTAFADNNSLDKAIDTLADKDLPNAFIGIIVRSSDGKVYYKRNANKHFIPASNVKLFTCTAAMLDLGRDFKYTTAFKLYRALISNGTLDGNLYIKFTGDPTYTTKELHLNLEKLRKLGIRTIRGNVVLDNTGYSGSYYAPGMSLDDLGNSYAAPVSSLILDNNLLRLEIKGDNNIGSPAIILPNPQKRYFKINNDIVTEGKNRNGDNYADITVQIDDKNNIRLSGSISSNYKKEKVIAIQDPVKYASRVIETELRRCNITFDKRVISGKTPPNTDPIIVSTSKPLPDLVKHALKESDNLYTDSFLKTMGVQRNGIGTFEKGLGVLDDTIRQITEIRFRNIQLYDGCGLSRYNLVTPEQISMLLMAVYNNEELNEYIINALPVSGVDGTLKNRMKSKDIKGSIKAKTGTMGGVSALSGYIFIGRKSPIIFSIISNGIVNKQNPGIAKDFEDALCKLLLKHFSSVNSK
jgi:serine-type D-Ala-D-Ala carboxypeptidase/endopeptidase (penicillin-binding protein 4)